MVEEGDLIVSEDGEITEVDIIYENDRKPVFCEGVVKAKRENVIKVDNPLRIKVDSELQANHVVEYAEGNGFTCGVRKANYLDFKEPYTVYELVNLDGEPKKAIDCVVADDNYDLTFSDYDQWTAWVSYYAEDDEQSCPDPRCDDGIIDDGPFPYPCPNTDCYADSEELTQSVKDDVKKEVRAEEVLDEIEDEECETCGGLGEIHGGDMLCPDCTDDNEWSEPAPEDKEWRCQLYEMISPLCGTQKEFMKLGFEGTDTYHAIRFLTEYIDQLESKLEDCWENQRCYKDEVERLNCRVSELKEERDELRNRLDDIKNILGVDNDGK